MLEFRIFLLSFQVSLVYCQYYPPYSTGRPSDLDLVAYPSQLHTHLETHQGHTQDHQGHTQAHHGKPVFTAIDVGPFKPWSFPPKYQTDPLNHPVHNPSKHPGYQTNIIIDPYAKNDEGVVEIITQDLATGVHVGQTSWSGPGTLTLSSLTSLHGAWDWMQKRL
ncbi:uncharacterized protein LOC111716745 isoform X2 [Eurytemora carolleeae]|uniref:uncharacterized protein LOC111716745 isoform X2 n=1 Tax=Eurytemora carolleeae TaxID=1294199 RepID=UPI000C7734C5|nr:uncharacterized protein LOC111716745 isoform X2 [Eurytemora carolleeae]|eukprot:XP_023347989.1 uncharacterized protein LOC111716745 isoform X2 [Eurytemora affinis]